MDHFLRVYWIYYNIVSILCFGFFGCKACGILVPQPGIEPTHPVLEGSLNHWTTREVPRHNGIALLIDYIM